MDKWQHMESIVSQNATVLQPDFKKQFKKLCISRYLAENLLAFLLQYAGLMFSTLTSSSTLLWLASGTAAGFIFLRGYSILPGIWLGGFFAYYFSNTSILLASGCAIVFTLQAYLLFWLNLRYISPTPIIYRLTTLLKFLICSSALTATASFLLVLLCYSTLRHPLAPTALWLHWWLSNLNGILLFSIAIITWDMYFPQISALKYLSKTSIGALYGGLLILILLLLFSNSMVMAACLTVATLPLIIIISLRYGWCGTVSAMLLLTVGFSIVLTFGGLVLSSRSIIFLQGFLAIEMMVGLMIARASSQKLG